jgi:hypothetical protein
MNPLWAVALLAALCTCCVGEPASPAQRLIETWRPDVEASLEMNPQTRTLSPEDRTRVRAVAGQFLEDIRYEFTADGRLRRTIGGTIETHPYRIMAERPQGLELEVDDGHPPRTVLLTFHDDLLFWKRGAHTMVFEED